MRYNLKSKLLIPILCAIILGSLITGIVGYQAANDIVIDALMEDGIRSANYLCVQVDMVLSKAQHDLLAITVAPSVRHLLEERGSPDVLEEYMSELVNQEDLYYNMVILNIQGVIAASTSGITGLNRANQTYFQAGFLGGFFISDVEESGETGNLLIRISHPIYDGDENLIGVAMVSLQLEELNRRFVVPVSLLGEHGYAMIATGRGIIIGHKDENIIGNDMPDSTMRQLARLFSVGGSGSFESEIFDENYMAFSVRSDYADWCIMVLCPVKEFYSVTNGLAVLNIVLSAVLIITLTAIVWFVVRDITQALSETVKYSEALSKGNLEVTLYVDRNDEIGMIAQSLSKMAEKLKNMIQVSEKRTAEVDEINKIITENIRYANKMQKNFLPSKEMLKAAFSDYSVIWKPRDIVGGDIYWAKSFNDGTVVCVCDCTGHGTSGALLTMLVVSAFESSITEEKHKDTAEILFMLDQRLSSFQNVSEEIVNIMDINDGCDLAVLYIAKDGTVTTSAGNTNVFICDGKEVTRLKGQSIRIGDGRIKSKDEIDVHTIPANPDNKFYIPSDGLSDQIGGDKEIQYGYREFQKIILGNHWKKQEDISDKIWIAFKKYRGNQPRRDDFQLFTFKP